MSWKCVENVDNDKYCKLVYRTIKSKIIFMFLQKLTCSMNHKTNSDNLKSSKSSHSLIPSSSLAHRGLLLDKGPAKSFIAWRESYSIYLNLQFTYLIFLTYVKNMSKCRYFWHTETEIGWWTFSKLISPQESKNWSWFRHIEILPTCSSLVT